MTGTEAYIKFGHTPFVYLSDAGNIYSITMLDCEEMRWELLEKAPGYVSSKFSVGDEGFVPIDNFTGMLLDWLEDESAPAPSGTHACICNFYEVVLKTGCQCGGV